MQGEPSAAILLSPYAALRAHMLCSQKGKAAAKKRAFDRTNAPFPASLRMCLQEGSA